MPDNNPGEAVTLMCCDGCDRPTEIRDWPDTFPEDRDRICRCDCGSATGRHYVPADTARRLREQLEVVRRNHADRVGDWTKAEARAIAAEKERDEAIKARNAMNHVFDELQDRTEAREKELLGALEQLRNGPDTLTPDGLKIVNAALANYKSQENEG